MNTAEQQIMTMMNPPCVLCCGYREIVNPKTLNKFPLWLILFDDTVKRWRSKRDWLILWRAVKKCSPNTTDIKLPKSALDKLAKKAPWQREGVTLEIDSEDFSGMNHFNITMRKAIRELDGFMFQVKSSNNIALRDAWAIFEQSQDTTSCTNTNYSQQNAKIGSQLGQYFCTQDNANQLTQLASAFIHQNPTISTSLTFLEPSCGHGQIIEVLLENFTEENRIIACDIDILSFQICCHKFNRNTNVHLIHKDFLQTKPNSVRNDTSLIVLGGPPYTSGAGSSQKIKRDLPERFLDHCISTWNAQFIAFILPQRYRSKPIQVHHYATTTLELSSSKFFFQAEQEVTQPSIIQCYVRKTWAFMASTANETTTDPQT